jgi:hypothetical protein
MKSKIFFTLFLGTLILAGCAENEIIDTNRPEYVLQEKTFTLTATMPGDGPDTRIALTSGPGNYPAVALRWEEGDQIELCLVQAGKKVKQTVTVKNISQPDGKTAEFEVTVPPDFTGPTFDVYGIYGGGGLNDTNPALANISPADIPDNSPVALTGENSLQSKKMVALTFSQTGVSTASPDVDASFAHLGSMICLRLKNTGNESLNTEGKVFVLSSSNSSQWQVYGNYSFDITAGANFTTGETDAQFASEQAIASGQTVELWTWIVPTGNNTGSLDFWMYDAANSAYKRSNNFLPGRDNLQAGRTYYINAEWNGSEFTFPGGIQKPNTYTITFEEEYYTPFIEFTLANGTATQSVVIPGWAGGPNAHPYPWVDPVTRLTTLQPTLSWGSGYPWILSPYNSKNNTAFGDYLHDLYVYHPTHDDATAGGGNNGSNHFITTFGYQETGNPYMPDDGRPIFSFEDGTARTIESCYVNSTCYFLNVAANGNSLSPALGEGEDVILHATGYDADDNETGTVTMTFATKDKLITRWTKWNLSALGKVVTLKINMTGGTDNGYGFSLPAYYAIDDITVNLE